MKKKTIIILAIVAVAAYLLWKKGVFSKNTAASSGDTPAPGVDVNSVEAIIAASGMTSTDASVVRKFVAKTEASAARKAEIERKAIERGYTYAQMVVLDALWSKYLTLSNGQSVWKDAYVSDKATQNYYKQVTNTIKNL